MELDRMNALIAMLADTKKLTDKEIEYLDVLGQIPTKDFLALKDSIIKKGT